MNMKLCGLAAALALAFGTSVAQAQTTTSPATPGATSSNRSAQHDMHKAEKEKIAADYKADKAKCDGMKGNAKDVCMKEAKGKEKVAKAELDAKDDTSGKGQYKVDKAKAEAAYDVAKEKCDDQKGKEKSACEKEAKAQRDQALASAKGEKKSGASTGATTSNSASVKR